MDDSERREIAKVLMAALLNRVAGPGPVNKCHVSAVEMADALVAELDKTRAPDPPADDGLVVRRWAIVTNNEFGHVLHTTSAEGCGPMSFKNLAVAKNYLHYKNWPRSDHAQVVEVEIRVVRRDAPTPEPDA